MSDEFTNRLDGRLEIEHRDTLAAARNIATNGRLFAVMLFVANLVAFDRGNGHAHWHLALGATLVVGLSYITEAITMPQRYRVASSIAVAALASAVFTISFIR